MMVTFISQCEKNALKKTRRVLDAFANRIGDNAWQTVITEEGLKTVKKMLRQTASKSTAVSCHWIRSRARSQFLWVVGNKSKFDGQGYVPVNSTQEEGWINKKEYLWGTARIIALLSGIAGLFHDVGKANKLFQEKLNPRIKSKKFEPYRHEWVSLRIFEGLVRAYTINFSCDQEWLQALATVDNSIEVKVLEKLVKDDPHTTAKPFSNLPPIAKVVAWLIVAHHRLPIYPYSRNDRVANNPPSYSNIDTWLGNNFDSLWNSPSSFDEEWGQTVRNGNWVFPHGTPLVSTIWQIKARELANEALQCTELTQQSWFEQRFTSHLARLSLMLADHYYSSLPQPKTKWQDPNYLCNANTDHFKQYKQKLEEHNIGVALNALDFAKKLPSLKASLPTVPRNKKLIKNYYKTEEQKQRFGWQDKSYKLAKSLNVMKKHGFFGVNMASTGFGKTLANARIMYGLADEKLGCRFNIALGLRTLTLQTGKALAAMLELKKEDYAVLIGSQAVKKLFDKRQDYQTEQEQNYRKYNGSESTEDLLPDDQYIDYGGILNNEMLSKWLEKSPKLQQLIEAPLLISTIDHLMPATEGTRGGKQIAPMLRLLTSDLVLDEPDDFGLEDLPALCRLVNWAAMLGGRVLLSTATMPPALAYSLFQSYQAGWRDFIQANEENGANDQICCGWFDEFRQESAEVCDFKHFKKHHDKFVENRIASLSKESKVLRKARFLPISCSIPDNAISKMADVIATAIPVLHQEHHQPHSSGKTVSIGLVRMANITSLVALAKALFQIKPPDNYRLHYCVYHSQYPLAVRNYIEEKLDAALRRDNKETLWQQAEIIRAINEQPGKHQIFVVLASPVAEVGRDHDYDWAIAEPSSMRSLIQLAGRIQRHRKQPPTIDNLLILSKNVKALLGMNPAYCNPGFEINAGKVSGNNSRCLSSHDLSEVLRQEQIDHINATPRIQPLKARPQKDKNERYLNFVEMEQWALFQQLLGANSQRDKASYWWEHQAAWCAEIQRRQPFRQSAPDAPYCLRMTGHEEVCWTLKDSTKKRVVYLEAANITPVGFDICDGNQTWFEYTPENIYRTLGREFQLGDISKISEQFGVLRLRTNTNNIRPDIQWCYNPYLGVFNEI